MQVALEDEWEKEMNSPLSTLQKKLSPDGPLDFNSVRSMSDFWPKELQNNNSVLF